MSSEEFTCSSYRTTSADVCQIVVAINIISLPPSLNTRFYCCHLVVQAIFYVFTSDIVDPSDAGPASGYMSRYIMSSTVLVMYSGSLVSISYNTRRVPVQRAVERDEIPYP